MKKLIFSGILLLMVAVTLMKVRAQQPPAQSHKHLMMVVEKGLPGATIFDADTDQPICNANVGIRVRTKRHFLSTAEQPMSRSTDRPT